MLSRQLTEARASAPTTDSPPPVQAVGHPAPLLITHRLDQVTEGVLVLGKTPEFVARFNALIRRDDRAVRKWYRALSADPPPPGGWVGGWVTQLAGVWERDLEFHPGCAAFLPEWQHET